MDGESPVPDVGEGVVRAMVSASRADRGAPLARRLRGVNVIDFSDAASLYAFTSVNRKILLLVLLLALKDRAGAVLFEPRTTEAGGHALGLFYEVDGRWHELMPPPAHLASGIIREIKAVAGFGSMRRRLADLLRRLASRLDAQIGGPSYSHFRMKAGDQKIEISALVTWSAIGDRVFLKLPDAPEALAESAQDAQAKIFATTTS